tara:strand:- start:644 stop:1351 length:708 start_codon:yes stop_codon:yes gene_type:complete
MNELKAYNPWPTIFKKTWDFDFENKLKDRVISSLKASDQFINEMNIETPERNGGVTTVVLDQDPNHPMPHMWPEFKEFGQFVLQTSREVAQKWHCNPAAQRAVAKSWINVHPQDGYTIEHNHHGVLMAVVAYLYVPPNGGNLLVKNPLTPYKFGEPIHPGYFSDVASDNDGLEWTPIQVETNDVVFFPGWLNHKTEKNMSRQNRFVMSWNISYASETQMLVAGNLNNSQPIFGHK